MTIKALFFDLDGTLLYTIEDIATSLNGVLSKHGYPTHSVDQYCQFIGDGMKMLVLRALPEAIRINKPQAESIIAQFREAYSVVDEPTTQPYDGIMPLLKNLQDQGYYLAVVTNKPHDKALAVVDQFFPNVFDAVVGQREGIPVKPDPYSAKELQNSANLASSEIIYIGDSGVDMSLAVTAGYLPVAVEWGYRSTTELLEKGAKIVISTPLDLLSHIQ